MNILIFSWRGPGHPDAGGAEISIHEHTKGWVKAGHQVTLFTSNYPKAKNEEVIDGVNIIRSGSQFLGVQWQAFKWYLFGKHMKYDLVIDQFHGIPFFIPLYINEKKIAFIHEVTKEVWSLNLWPQPFNLIPASIGRLLEPLVFELFYKKIPFITVSDSTKEDLMKWGIPRKNITVIHNGLNQPKIKSSIKEKKKTVVFLGALSKDKGIEDALQCFSILKQRGNFNFWIIGKPVSDKYQQELKKIAKKVGLEKKIVFYGFISESRKFKLLSRAHLLIHPSAREGWGLVVIEAAAVGTPTIGYEVAGLKDSIIDNQTGILTKQNTPEEMAENVLSLMSDQPRYIRMCRFAKKWSNKFSWDNSVKQSLSLLKEVYENT